MFSNLSSIWKYFPKPDTRKDTVETLEIWVIRNNFNMKKSLHFSGTLQS